MRNNRPYDPVWNAGQILDGVEQWADGCYLLRETGCIGEGRLDGMIIPASWNAPVKSGIHGVEVKISRADFLRGLRGGQFEKYLKYCNTLYIATGLGVCKTSEIPQGIGHLVVALRDEMPVCVCKRHAHRYPGQFSEKFMWRMVFDLFDQFRKVQRRSESVRRDAQNYVGKNLWNRVEQAAKKAAIEIEAIAAEARRKGSLPA